jgi:quinol monooxygenase YgiN
MPVTYVIRFTVVPDRVPRFLSLLESVLDAMREETNFHQAILHRDPQNSSHFMLYETWEDHDDVLNVQIHKPYRRAFHEALPEVLAGPRDITMWEPVRADRRR